MTTNHTPEPRWAGLKEVLGMAFPIILGTLSFTVMQFADQVMVARLGSEALAAVGSAGLWSFTLSTFLMGIVGCVGTFVSQSFGRGEKHECASYAWQGVYLAFLTGATILVLWPVSMPLFGVMGHAPRVTEFEVSYFRLLLFGYLPMAWLTALTAFFQAVSRPRIPMITAIICNAVNILLNYLLIFGKFGFPRWEIRGAAVATVISVALQAVMLQGVFLNGAMNEEYGTRRTFRIDLTKMRELFRIGWPAGVSFFIDVFNWGIFTSFLVGRFGTTALAAHVAATNFMHVSFMPAVGLNNAIAPIVGQWIGRDNIPTAKARTYTAMKLAVVYMTLMGLIMAVFGGRLIRLCFSDDPEVIRLGHYLLILAAVFQGFDATNIITMGALRGAGDTRYMAVVVSILAYLLFLPLAWVLGHVLGLAAVGAWIGATVYIILLSLVLFRRFNGERWRHIRIFEKDRQAAD